ncbi:hypothetical protein EG329_001533 [Mollisiaceae sp. DMI_Dod_QoI]|nr:hypothetical protein EG329_001533 [Helotiales sp. DMI_Dod_QoI]
MASLYYALEGPQFSIESILPSTERHGNDEPGDADSTFDNEERVWEETPFHDSTNVSPQTGCDRLRKREGSPISPDPIFRDGCPHRKTPDPPVLPVPTTVDLGTKSTQLEPTSNIINLPLMTETKPDEVSIKAQILGSLHDSHENVKFPERAPSESSSADLEERWSSEIDSANPSPCCSDISDNGGEAFLEITFQEHGKYASRSPTTSIVSHGSGNNSSLNTTPVSSLNSSAYNSRGASSGQRRRRSIDEEDDPNQPNRPWKRQRPGPNDTIERSLQQGRRLACPFNLRDERKYSKNMLTGKKKYETCSGPGWFTMHHLKQHLGNSASSVHKKIRCPHCLKPFKTATAVLKHQEGDCSGFEHPGQEADDICKEEWTKIERDVSRSGFEKLSLSKRQAIDQWVLKNLEFYAPNETMETRRSELRKWYIAWGILFTELPPAHPFYEVYQEVLPSNTSLLIRTFKELVEAGVQKGEIDGITDENLEKLQKCLRTAIHRASKDCQQTHNTRLREDFPGVSQEPPFAGAAGPSEAIVPPGQHSQWDTFDTHTQSQNHSQIKELNPTLDIFSTDNIDAMIGSNFGAGPLDGWDWDWDIA